jgi:hypothetical protein
MIGPGVPGSASPDLLSIQGHPLSTGIPIPAITSDNTLGYLGRKMRRVSTTFTSVAGGHAVGDAILPDIAGTTCPGFSGIDRIGDGSAPFNIIRCSVFTSAFHSGTAALQVYFWDRQLTLDAGDNNPIATCLQTDPQRYSNFVGLVQLNQRTQIMSNTVSLYEGSPQQFLFCNGAAFLTAIPVVVGSSITVQASETFTIVLEIEQH